MYQNSLEHQYFARMLGAIRSACETKGYDLTFLSNKGVSEYGYAAHAMRRNCDGVLVTQGNIDLEDLDRLGKSPLPVVSVDREFAGRTCVWNENTASMRQIVDYVAERGHTRIAFVHGEKGDVTRERIQAFCDACAVHGIDVPESYLVEAKFQEPKDSGLATRQLMALPEPPSCILFPDDVSYLGGFTELERQGKSIPEDVSCVGYDGIRLASLLRPRLTTYRQDAEEVGRVAAEELFCAIERGEKYKPRRIVIPGAMQDGSTVRNLRE